MARKPGRNPQAIKARAAKTAAVMGTPSAAALGQPKKGGLIEGLKDFPKFTREVRAEVRKITWTSRKETWITSVMVAIMVVMAAIFFKVVDVALGFGVNQILKLANGG